MNVKPNYLSNGQEKNKKVPVSEQVLDECADNKFKAATYKAQRDSVIENQKPKPLNLKEKGLWAGIGAAVIIILRLLIK